MAESKAAQQAKENQIALAVLSSDVKSLEADFAKGDLPSVRERLAGLEDRVTELRKSKEEADRRYWQFVVLFVGGILTLAINLVVSFVRK